MGKLYFELDSIDINIQDKAFWTGLYKFYQSQRTDKIYNDILAYDITKLPDSKKSLFVGMARRRFEYLDKRDISPLLEHDTGYYSIYDVSKRMFYFFSTV